MKKFLAVMLITLTVIFTSCGSKYSDETFLKENATWVENKDDIIDFLDIVNEMDEDFFQQLYIDGKIKGVDKETKIHVSGELHDGKIVEIKFLQGRYKNKIGYTIPEFIIDIGKEKEIAEKESTRIIPLEKFSDTDKQAYDSLVQNGVQISNLETWNYGVSGNTNLPDFTKVSIMGVETVIKNKRFSVRLAAPPSKDFSIHVLDMKVQPMTVKSVDAAIIARKGEEHSISNKTFCINE